MNRKGKKELLNNWQNMSVEERENKVAELESSLPEKKFKKIINSIQKIENSLKDDSINHEINEFETQESTNENFANESTPSNEEHVSEDNYTNESNESTPSNEEHVSEDNYTNESNDENLEKDSLIEEVILSNDVNNLNEEELNQTWVIDENELNVESNSDQDLGLDNQMFESEINKEYVPVDFSTLKMSSNKEQIGSDERAWNKNKDIIYSQEELIYRLSNSVSINDEEYRMLLISAQKKIEFIQLLIEKSRVKNAAYSYDFLNSMCWRVDKALKTFLANNKR